MRSQSARSAQQGLSLVGLILVFVIVVFVALFGMKLVPSYLEYRSAKNAIDALARSGGATPTDIRRNFESRSVIDGIEAVKPSDLDITKQGNQVVIAFAYRKEIPLFANVGIYIDFAASSLGD